MKKLILAAVAAVSIASLPVKAGAWERCIPSDPSSPMCGGNASPLSFSSLVAVAVIGGLPIFYGERFAAKWEREDEARQAAYRDRLPPSLSDLMDLGIQASRRVELASTD